MKQRITYLLPEGNRAESTDVQVGKDSLNFTRASEAAEEWRLTLGWSELPVEIQTILSDCHELHLRWTSTRNFGLRSPLVARVPAGLHAFYTPRVHDRDVPICELLRKSMDGQSTSCHSVSKSWTRPPVLSERFAATSTYQYYQFSASHQHLGKVFLEQVCKDASAGLDECREILGDLTNADYIDVDFDAISHAVIFTAFWGPSDVNGAPSTGQRGPRAIRKSRASDAIEVGILNPETAKEPEQLSLGGYLTVVGESDHPSVTLFSFPARHHLLPASSPTTYKAHFQQPTGLHPKLDISLPRQYLDPPKPACALHAYWTLPSALFIDRYQLSDPLFLASQNLVKLHSLAGEDDLEAPDWVINRWGSAALLELATPSPKQPTTKHDSDWTVTIPTHLRYLTGRSNSTHPTTGEPHHTDRTELSVPWPIVFWACEAEEGLKMATNPFDRVNLGYDGLFGPKTMFYHVPAAPDVKYTFETLDVPVLDVENASWVSGGTLIAVALGFAWVCWQLVQTTLTGGEKRSDAKRGKRE